MSSYTEDDLVEQPTIRLFSELGWETAILFYERFGPENLNGRTSANEVILTTHLKMSLRNLNPQLPQDALEEAVEALREERGGMTLVQANRHFYGPLKGGIKVRVTIDDEETTETDKVID